MCIVMYTYSRYYPDLNKVSFGNLLKKIRIIPIIFEYKNNI